MVAIGYMLLHDSDDGPASHEPEYRDQRKLMLRMARRLGDSLGRIPCDRAVAARQGLSKRTCLAEVLALVRRDRQKTVIICGVDELALSEIERALLMQQFSKLSVEVWDASSGENLTMDMGRWKRIVADSDQNERRAASQAIMQLKKIATRLCNKKTRPEALWSDGRGTETPGEDLGTPSKVEKSARATFVSQNCRQAE